MYYGVKMGQGSLYPDVFLQNLKNPKNAEESPPYTGTICFPGECNFNSRHQPLAAYNWVLGFRFELIMRWISNKRVITHYQA